MCTHSLVILLLLLTESLYVSASPISIPPNTISLLNGETSLLSGTDALLSTPEQLVKDLGSSVPLPGPLSSLPILGHNKFVTLPMARRFNSTGASNILKFDQERAKSIRQRAQARSDGKPLDRVGDQISVPATSQAVSYVVSVRLLDFISFIRALRSNQTFIGEPPVECA